MATVRSSVRPASSKQPWGTIIKPNFGMGYQKMTKYEVDQSMNRLYTHKRYRERDYYRHQGRPMSSSQIEAMVSNERKCVYRLSCMGRGGRGRSLVEEGEKEKIIYVQNHALFLSSHSVTEITLKIKTVIEVNHASSGIH